MSTIKLVKNDARPIITLTLTDESTGQAMDLSASSTTVSMYFRRQGTTVRLATIVCTKLNGGIDGVVQLKFASNELNVAAGLYEGEVEINWNGEKQTVYDTLKFKVRDEF